MLLHRIQQFDFNNFVIVCLEIGHAHFTSFWLLFDSDIVLVKLIEHFVEKARELQKVRVALTVRF